jgi:hypothetical protein
MLETDFPGFVEISKGNAAQEPSLGTVGPETGQCAATQSATYATHST